MARILVSTKDLSHEKWLEYRRTGIGGSDASTIGSEATKQAIDELNAVDNGLSTNVNQDLLNQYKNAKVLLDDAKSRFEAIKNKIKNQLGECGYGECDGYKISWKGQNKTTVDSKKLKNLYPDIYNKVAKTSTSRVLRISESED